MLRKAAWVLPLVRDTKSACNLLGGNKMTEEEYKEAEEYINKYLKDHDVLIATPEEDLLLDRLTACINCGTCTMYCPLLDLTNGELSPRKIAIEVSRTEPDWKTVRKIVYDCTLCGKCEEVCPESVPVPRIVKNIRARILRQSPSSMLPEYIAMQKNLTEMRSAYIPMDEEDKQDYIEDDLENFGWTKTADKYLEKAGVVYFGGCQARERLFLIRESVKLLLEALHVDYSLLEEEGCCGLPASLIGDVSLSDDLANSVIKKCKEKQAKIVLTTCAGCTAKLKEDFQKFEAGIDVKHLIEYIIEDIGLEAFKKMIKKSPPTTITVTLHNPCDLHRGSGKYFVSYTEQILKNLPNIIYETLPDAERCCGAGGLSDLFIPDVTKELQKQKAIDIQATPASIVIAPCPRCINQIEEGLHEMNSEKKVLDMSMFLNLFLYGGFENL
ncbi:MAG: (Fe-S)-binding protein [Candidatus Helarchaeota archaeon]